MPSYVAWGAAILSVVVGKLLSLPLKWLQLLVPLPGLFAFLRYPFTQMAALVLLLGAVLQSGMLVEELAMDKLGSSLNSAAKSSSSPLSSLPSLRADLAKAEEQLSNLETSYPSTVATLLDKALALPAIPEGSDITFTAADVEEWEEGSKTFRFEYERLAEQATRQWVDVLTFDPARGSSFLPNPTDPSTPPNSASPKLVDPVFLAAVQAEMQLIQAGRPSKAVYAEREYDEEDWAKEKEEKERKEREEQAKKDKGFEQFLDSMFQGAEGAASGQADTNGDPSATPKQDDSTAASSPSPPKRPRELLDQPQNPSLPISSTNPTWRTTLRHQWGSMYDSAHGGIVGEAMQSLSQDIADLRGEAVESKHDDGTAEKRIGWTPKSLPLMANHLLRAHLQQATSLSAPQVNDWEKVWGVNTKEEEQILPAILSGLSSEFLSPIQRAVRVDQQARKWATAFLSLFLTPPPPPPSTAAPSDSRTAASLLRSSPFPPFIRTTEALFALPLTHMRIGVSKHEMAYGVFANQAQVQQGGKEGQVGRIAVEWAVRQVAQLRRDVKKAEEHIEMADKEGKRGRKEKQEL